MRRNVGSTGRASDGRLCTELLASCSDATWGDEWWMSDEWGVFTPGPVSCTYVSPNGVRHIAKERAHWRVFFMMFMHHNRGSDTVKVVN
jgi:hypothetical protein